MMPSAPIVKLPVRNKLALRGGFDPIIARVFGHA